MDIETKPIQLRRIKKEFFDGTHRVISPEKTYEMVNPLMEILRVPEIIDVTEYERLGIPVFGAPRPGAARGGKKIHWGKGKEELHAKVSAMMEAVERYSAEYRGSPLLLSGYEMLGLRKAIDPHSLYLPRRLEVGEEIHWSAAWDILNDEPVYVPSNAIYHPYDPMGMAQQLFRSDTNGIASGNVLEEAILHAILEVVERDAISVAEWQRSMGRRLTITQDGPAKKVLDQFTDAGIDIHLWLLDGKTGIPTVAAASDDTLTKDPGMLVMGSGSHLNPEIAALRALNEVAQSRASELYMRDQKEMADNDPRVQILAKAGYDRMKRINGMWFKEAESIDLSEIPDTSTEYIDEDIRICLKEIEEHAERVCVYTFSRTEIPVVRVVIPGFEVSYMDPSRRSGLAAK